MSSATQAQVTRWQQTIEEVEARSPNPRDEHASIAAALGDDYDSFKVTLHGATELALSRFFARVTPSEYREMLLSIDDDSSYSIADFQGFSGRSNLVPIDIGRVGNTSIRLCAEPYLLQAHELESEVTDLIDDSVADRRAMMPETILV